MTTLSGNSWLNIQIETGVRHTCRCGPPCSARVSPGGTVAHLGVVKGGTSLVGQTGRMQLAGDTARADADMEVIASLTTGAPTVLLSTTLLNLVLKRAEGMKDMIEGTGATPETRKGKKDRRIKKTQLILPTKLSHTFLSRKAIILCEP